MIFSRVFVRSMVLVIFSIIAMRAFAVEVPEAQVRIAAEKWLKSHPDFTNAKISSLEILAPIPSKKNVLRLARIAPQGYLILNGNDVLPVVQMYSTDSLSAEMMTSDGFKIALSACAESNEAICEDAENNSENKSYLQNQAVWTDFLTEIKSESKQPKKSFSTGLLSAQSDPAPLNVRVYSTNIGPLIRSNFYQTLPLNYFAPFNSGGGDWGGVVIGCAATAYSMLIDAHQWPTYGSGVGIHNNFALTYFKDQLHGFYYSDYRPKYDWANFITKSGDGAMYNRLQTNRFGFDVATTLRSNFGVGATGASIYGDRSENLKKRFRYSGEIVVCSETMLKMLDGYSHPYKENWATIMEENLREKLPVAGSIMYGSIGSHAIVVNGLREYTLNGKSYKEVNLNYGWGGHFWTSWDQIVAWNGEKDFKKQYFMAFFSNFRPNPVPLPDPVPRTSNPNTVVTWTIPKHYEEMQGDKIKQRIKFVKAAAATGTENYPLTATNNDIVLTFSGSDLTYEGAEPGLEFSNYQKTSGTVSFKKPFSVSAESMLTFDVGVGARTTNRPVKVFASLDNTTWEELSSQTFTGSGDLWNCELGD